MKVKPIDIRFAASFLACLALLFQTLAPYAVAAARGIDIASVLCEPGGMDDVAAREAQALLAELTGGEEKQTSAGTDHCGACLLAHVADLPETSPVVRPVAFTVATDRPAAEAAHFYFAQGPPLGLRAPPATTL